MTIRNTIFHRATSNLMYHFMKKSIIFILLIINGLAVNFAQNPKAIPVTWAMLSEVNEGRDYSPLHNRWVAKAEFSETIKRLENKQITIKGYLVPTDVTGDTYVISAKPFTSCFFCGGAGKETVMELRLQRQYLFTTDEVKTFRGTLKIRNSPYELYYLLEDAQPESRSSLLYED